MMQSNCYRRIFVLGSGFSKSFSPQMPTLRDLNELIPFGIPDEFPHFRDYCKRFLTLCNGDSDYLGIEPLATSILSSKNAASRFQVRSRELLSRCPFQGVQKQAPSENSSSISAQI